MPKKKENKTQKQSKKKPNKKENQQPKQVKQTKSQASQPKNDYTNDSISSLKGPEQVRSRPSWVFGTKDIHGCEHSFFEILSNSVDEAREGFGSHIHVKKFSDGSFSIEDEGRGIPLDYNKKEKEWNYVLLLETLFSGGKMEIGNYSTSLGLNGLGLVATNFASKWLEITSNRDGYSYFLRYEEGIRKTELSKTKLKSKSHTGTTVHWMPDIKVFDEINISPEYIKETLKVQAIVNAGLTFTFLDENTGEEFEICYPEGIVGFAKEITDDNFFFDPILLKTTTEGRDRADKPLYSLDVSICLGFSNKAQRMAYFHNSSPLEYGGSPERAAKEALKFAFDKYIKSTGKYTKTDSKIEFEDISDCLVFISSCFQAPADTVDYENQTKKSIGNKYVQDFLSGYIKESIELFSLANPEEMDKVCEQILINMRSRTSAEADRQVKKKKLMSKSSLSDKVANFVDCRIKDPNERELFICEGKSALSSLQVARDPEFQALMPVRGKILNCLKASTKEILASDIIMDLIKVMGCGMELNSKSKTNSFDIEKLKFNKILITSDADVDGYQIRCLILTMLYRLTPELVKQGYVYIADTPLYEVTYKGKIEFAYNDNELKKILKGKDEKKVSIQRSKGLGENDADMMWETTMKPGSRRLIKVEVKDIKQAEKTLELLMGDDIPPRKKYIEENGHLYSDKLDLS